MKLTRSSGRQLAGKHHRAGKCRLHRQTAARQEVDRASNNSKRRDEALALLSG